MSHALKLPREWLLRALELETDRERSPRELTRDALEAFRAALTEAWVPEADPDAVRDQLRLFAARLRRVRPSATALAAAMDRCLEAVHHGLEEVAAAVDAELRRAAEIGSGAVEGAERLLRPGGRVLTCGHDEVLEQILSRYSDRLERITVCEVLPSGSGQRLAAALARMALPVRIISIAQLEQFAGDWDLAIVPGERVLPNGDLVAPTGTAVLAQICAVHRIPFYAITHCSHRPEEADERSRFVPERRSPSELFPALPEGVEAVYLVSDLTPAALISGYLTEEELVLRRAA